MTPPFQHLRVDIEPSHMVSVWLDVAGRSVNVYSDSMVDELHALFDWLDDTNDATPIVFRSAKPRGFFAGADLGELAAFQSAADSDRFLERGQSLLDQLSRMARPTVAAIHGPCLGGGLELALACRHRIARDDSTTRLGLPETLLGLTPAWGGTRRLPRLIGLEASLRLMLTGQTVEVAEARQLGIIDAVARFDRFDEDVREFVLAASSSVERRVPKLPRMQRLRVMVAAKRQCGPDAKLTPAQGAVLAAVEAGYGDTSRDEATTIREDFARLVLSDECRERLAAFFRTRDKGR